MAREKNAYRVNNSLVNVGGVLYPITYSFIVKEVEQEASWLDDFEGSICECYNCFGWGNGSNNQLTTVMGSHPVSDRVTINMTFACNNLKFVKYEWLPGYFDYYGDLFIEAWTPHMDGGEVYDDSYRRQEGFCIGWPYNVEESPNVWKYQGGSNNTVMSFSVSTPSYGEMYYIEDPWGSNLMPIAEREKDMVFWLYECKITSPDSVYYTRWPDNSITGGYVFDPNYCNLQKSDALFLPGQQGRRIISNDWKYAPWERYPHLV